MKRIFMLITAIAVMIGLAASPANAEDGDFNVTLLMTDFASAHEEVTIKNKTRLVVNGGATQVTWENPRHNLSVTNRELRNAMWISTECTRANRFTQSQQIFRKTHGDRVVIVKPGSCLWNRGKQDNIMVGFKWKVSHPSVLVGKDRRYRHAFTLKQKPKLSPDDEVVRKLQLHGKTYYLIRKCANFIGGPVDHFVPAAVQIRYEEDVEYEGDVEATATVGGTATFHVTCPNGAEFNVNAQGEATGTASAHVEFTERTRVSVISNHRASLLHQSRLDADLDATADARLKITISGTCGDNPPPVTEAPTVDVTPVACVNPGTTRDVTITVSNPNDEADTAKVTYRGQVLPTKPVDAHGQVTFTLANQAAGTYSGTALLVNANKSKSFTVTVEECPPTPPTITEITTINDVVEYNTRTVNVMGTGTPGEIISLFATAKHGGSITAGKNQSLTVDGNGNWSATVEFTAGETPKSSLTYEVDGDSYTIAAGKDVIWFKASNTAGQYVWAKSNDFDITPRPVTP